MMENEIFDKMEKFKKEHDETFDNIINMLHEFDYKKNGRLMTIHFLSICMQLLSDDMLEERYIEVEEVMESEQN